MLKHFGWCLETRSLQRLIIGSGGDMRPISTLAFGGLMPQYILPHVMLPHSRLATDVAVRSLRWRLYGRNPCQKDLFISLIASGNCLSWLGRQPEEIVLISRLLWAQPRCVVSRMKWALSPSRFFQRFSETSASSRLFAPPVHVLVLPSKLPLDLRLNLRGLDDSEVVSAH